MTLRLTKYDCRAKVNPCAYVHKYASPAARPGKNQHAYVHKYAPAARLKRTNTHMCLQSSCYCGHNSYHIIGGEGGGRILDLQWEHCRYICTLFCPGRAEVCTLNFLNRAIATHLVGPRAAYVRWLSLVALRSGLYMARVTSPGQSSAYRPAYRGLRGSGLHGLPGPCKVGSLPDQNIIAGR